MILAEGRGSQLARERVCTSAENASTETPSSRASSLPQGHQCRMAFAWLETQPTCVSNPHSSKTPRPCVSVSHRPKTPRTCVSVSHGPKTPRTCGSELARERVCTSAENASTETPSSRASSLPPGHQCRMAFAWLETQPTCDYRADAPRRHAVRDALRHKSSAWRDGRPNQLWRNGLRSL